MSSASGWQDVSVCLVSLATLSRLSYWTKRSVNNLRCFTYCERCLCLTQSFFSLSSRCSRPWTRTTTSAFSTLPTVTADMCNTLYGHCLWLPRYHRQPPSGKLLETYIVSPVIYQQVLNFIQQCCIHHFWYANISAAENSSITISAEEVGICIIMLKLHKNDGGTGLNTNHFKYANAD